MVIPVPENDPIYGNGKMDYLPFLRTVTRPGNNGFLSPVEQVIHFKFGYH